MSDHELDYGDDHYGCYIFDFDNKNDHDSHENSGSSSDDADDNDADDNHDHDGLTDGNKTPENQSDELPQASSADTMLILNELRKLNSTVESLSKRLSSTERNLSSLKKKKKPKKAAIDVPVEVRVSS